MKKLLLFLIFLIFPLSLTGCGEGYEYVMDVECKVIEKDYVPATTRLEVVPQFTGEGVPIGNNMVLKNVPSEYNVKVSYDSLGITKTMDNSEIYNNYEVGDTIILKLYKNSNDEYTIRNN